jgi:predicted ATP-grasp superfamily ATP-dependent carboligase
MNAIVIGAGSESVFAINEAKDMGFNVIAFDENPRAEGLQEANFGYVVDIKKPGLIIRRLDSINILSSNSNIVLPVPIGRYLTSIGSINDYYRFVGIGFKGADYCTDKYKFHKLLSKNSLRNIDCILVKNGENKNKLNFPLKYPAVIKPRFSSGSRSVYIVERDEELKKIISNMSYDEDFLIENFKVGKEYGIDAAVIEGQFILILLREKLLTPFPYRQCVGYYTVPESDNDQVMFDRIREFMSDVVELMNLNNVLIHADIIYDNNSPFLIEISARPSGHYLHNIFIPLATGINIIREYLKFAVPELNQSYSFYPKSVKYMLIRYFDFGNCRVVFSPDKKKLLESYPLAAYEYNAGLQIMERVVDGSSIMNRGYFILEGHTRAELEKWSDAIFNQFLLERMDV